MMVEWLLKEYRTVLQSSISVSERMQYLPVRYSSTIKQYDDIFNYSSKGRERAIAMAEECINIRPSYIISTYNANVLEKYNEGLQSPELESRIRAIKMHLNESQNLIDVDMAMLEKVFDISIPDQSKLTKVVDHILSITIRHANASKKRNAVKNLNILVYQEKLIPYLQFYFTILELNLEDKFSDWIQRFRESDIFVFYLKNINQNERAIRWGQTLLASVI